MRTIRRRRRATRRRCWSSLSRGSEGVRNRREAPVRRPFFYCRCFGQERASRLLRRRSGSPFSSNDSTSRCIRSQTGTAEASRALPCDVRLNRRLRRSSRSGATLTSPRRSSGFSAAVRVVRSMASSEATEAMAGGSGRFSDIISENWPFVRPKGRSASSKRRARARAARCT
jgi:hypothetical protein